MGSNPRQENLFSNLKSNDGNLILSDKNSLWSELNIQGRQLCVKENFAHDPGLFAGLFRG